MKNPHRLILSTLLTLALVAAWLQSGLDSSAAKAPRNKEHVSQEKSRDPKIKTSPEVAQRVRQLKQANKQVRHALRAFEANTSKNNRAPKIEESWAITSRTSDASISRALIPRSTTNRKIAFRPQDIVSGDGVEIIFVPTYDAIGEWQGTVICNRYDNAGNFLEQYVSDVVLAQSPIDLSWDSLYEVSYEGNDAWLQSDPALGMIMNLNFEFGSPYAGQPQNGGPEQGPISSISRDIFHPAVYRFGGGVINPQPGWGPRIPGYGPNPRIKKVLKCTLMSCASTTAGCAVLALFRLPFGPCVLGSCVGPGIVRCTLVEVFGY